MTKDVMLKNVVAKLDGCRKGDIENVLVAYTEVVMEALKEDITDKVPLPGIGAFSGKTVPAKSGVSKLGGVEKEWSTPEHNEIKFTISKSVKTI